ncbi:MAG: hypothetical protein JO122_11930 [Acetobacteraceae bacterium]|nr:hypothetical protein [Acetobacteraceae bacterium]
MRRQRRAAGACTAFLRLVQMEACAARLPARLFDVPKTAFVAQFIGGRNVLGDIAVRAVLVASVRVMVALESGGQGLVLV